MATAVGHLWPEAKFGVGPVVENGFYYDIDLGETKISEDHFGKIEKEGGLDLVFHILIRSTHHRRLAIKAEN